MADWAITSWHGREVFTAAIEDNFVAMEKAARLVERYVKTHFKGGNAAAERARRAAGGKMQTGGISPRSKPGEAPAIQKGGLVNSIMYTVERSGLGINGKVGVEGAVKYARALELGYAPRNLKPRPYLRPAVAANKRKIAEIFRKANSA